VVIVVRGFDTLAKSHPELYKNLSSITDIRPCGQSFIGRSKAKLTATEARAISVKTGASILDVFNKETNKISVIYGSWLKGSYFSNSKGQVEMVALMNGQPCLLALDRAKGMASIRYSSMKEGQEDGTHHYLFQWTAPAEEMDKAARASGQFLEADADLKRRSAFYTGEWEYRLEGHVFRRILFPDGRAELWWIGRKWLKADFMFGMGSIGRSGIYQAME